MRAARFVGIAVFLGLIGYASAQSPQRPFGTVRPSPPPAAQDQRGTDQQPLSVKIVPSEKTEADREDEQKHRDTRPGCLNPPTSSLVSLAVSFSSQ